MKTSAAVKWLLLYVLLPLMVFGAAIVAYVVAFVPPQIIEPAGPYWQINVRNEGDKDCFIAIQACQLFIEEVRVPSRGTVKYARGFEADSITRIRSAYVGRNPGATLQLSDATNVFDVQLRLGESYTLVVNDQDTVWLDTRDDSVLRDYDPPVLKKTQPQ